jgi:uncharacterized membrane protein YkgB
VSDRSIHPSDSRRSGGMYSVFYLIGVVVVVLAVLSLIGVA